MSLVNESADGVIEVKPVTRSLEMFVGRCKRADEPTISIAEIDAAIMQAISENDNRHLGEAVDILAAFPEDFFADPRADEPSQDREFFE